MNKQRIHSIDIIRGLCILAVVLLHINIRLHFDRSNLAQVFPGNSLRVLLGSGYYGVIIFFVVSGFIITSTSIKRWGSLSNIKPPQFYWIRFARIMPLLLGVIIIISVLDLMHVSGFVLDPHKASLSETIFSALTFHFNVLERKAGHMVGVWDCMWSLSVEECFYFFFPMICRWVKNERYFTLLMLSFVIIGPFARSYGNDDIWQDHNYLSCMDGIALGCLAAIWASKNKFNLNALRVMLGLGLAAMLFVLVFRKTVFDLGLTKYALQVSVLEIGTALALIALYERYTRGINQMPKLTNFFCWFGRNSYEIYLTHMIIVIPLTSLFVTLHQSMKMAIVWYVGITFICGIAGEIVARYYSEPLNKALRSYYANTRNAKTNSTHLER